MPGLECHWCGPRYYYLALNGAAVQPVNHLYNTQFEGPVFCHKVAVEMRTKTRDQTKTVFIKSTTEKQGDTLTHTGHINKINQGVKYKG